ncbi:MAG: hypothetical protein GX433_05530 [Deltaproteobacteria bacterium]|jgi:hypothetical protein|nr:hypothetical protein [Deltaproteobacteria bacterium]
MLTRTLEKSKEKVGFYPGTISMDTALDRYCDSLPRRPYCSDDYVKHGLFRRDRESALHSSHIQLNGKRRAYICLDVDRPDAGTSWIDAGVPAPTILALNTENGHGHLFWELESPVSFPDCYGRGKAREKPQAYWKAVKRAYELRLQADTCYAGVISKNPTHGRWRVIAHDNAVYDLPELADYVDLTKINTFSDRASGPGELPDVIPEGYRDATVFDHARYRVYRKVHSCKSAEELFSVTYDIVMELNTRCSPPMSERQCRSIANGISKWCWARRAKSIDSKNRGIMGLPEIAADMEAETKKLEIRNRQRMSAEYTNALQRKRTEERVLECIRSFKFQGKRVSKAAVAREIGMQRAELSRRYAHLFQK